MNDEIKEILDAWKNKKYILAYTFNYDSAREQNDKLLDYITNLQKENERLEEELKYTIPDVQHNQIVTKLAKEKNDYKSRCEKAIKCIDTNFCIENRRDLKEVVNILQGENNGN